MRLSQLLKWIGFFTVIALVYIHMQMQIINLAYEGKNKEKNIRSLKEDNGYLTYSILSLKSSSNLGFQLLSKESDMEFVESDNVMILSTSEKFEGPEFDVAISQDEEKPNFLLSLLPFGSRSGINGIR